MPYCECASQAEGYCKHLLNGPSAAYYNWCKHDYVKGNCSKLPKPKEIASYNYGQTIIYTDIPGKTNPFKEVKINRFFNLTETFEGPQIIIPDWIIDKSKIPSTSANICIIFHILIVFQDGTSCHRSKVVCNIIG